MMCKWCNKEILSRFYVHVNSSHHSNLSLYFAEFPDQKAEYEANKPKHGWNKGLTKENNASVAIGAAKVKTYTNQDFVKKERSERLKNLYKERGDILSPEQRAKVVKIGSDAWIKKLQSSSFEERRVLLEAFTSAGNKAQEERRPHLTPEDYQRLYPFAKGIASWYNCDECDDKFITWLGGDVKRKTSRPKKRFCDKECYRQYLTKHPYYALGGRKTVFHSVKMNKDIELMGEIELKIAQMLDKSSFVKEWDSCPYVIHYEYEGKFHKYYPDFIIDGYLILEVKSQYIFSLASDKIIAKSAAAQKWCLENKLMFVYLEFPKSDNRSVENDLRVRRIILGEH